MKAKEIGVETGKIPSFRKIMGKMLIALSLFSIASIAYVLTSVPAA